MRIRSAIAACLAALISATASAQEPKLTPDQARQLACVSDKLIAQKLDASIARSYARGDAAGAEYETNFKAMDAAMIACQQEHKWSDDQTNLAAHVGLYQMVLDNFSLALSNAKGVTGAAFDQLGTVLTGLPRSDQDILLDGSWRDDDAATKRIAERLIAAGLPSDSTTLAFAFLVMEAKLNVIYATMDWAEMTP